jgi:beta-lactamase regulating signal transducer with metallopeptidase domain
MLLPRLAIVLMKGAFVLGTVLGVRLVLRNRMDAASRYQLVLLALIGLPLLAAIEVLEPGIPPPDSPAVSVAADLSAAPGEPDSAPPIVKPDRPRFKVPKAAADMAIVLWLSVGSMLALRALGSRFATARRIRLLPLPRSPMDCPLRRSYFPERPPGRSPVAGMP